jgi:hypothetical protein
MRPTNIDGLSRCAATMQMASTAGKMAMTASLMTRAMRSPSVQSVQLTDGEEQAVIRPTLGFQ